MGLVRQADADERTPGALRAVDQRRRDATGSGRGASPGDGRERLGEQRLVDRHADPLLGLDVVDHCLVTAITVVSQDEGLDGDLNAVGIPGVELAGLACLSAGLHACSRRAWPRSRRPRPGRWWRSAGASRWRA